MLGAAALAVGMWVGAGWACGQALAPAMTVLDPVFQNAVGAGQVIIPTNGALMYIVADDNSSSPVTTWTDRMGNADFHALNTTAAPTLQTGALNGHSIVSFNGTTNYMTNVFNYSLTNWDFFMVRSVGGSNYSANAGLFVIHKTGENDYTGTNSCVLDERNQAAGSNVCQYASVNLPNSAQGYKTVTNTYQVLEVQFKGGVFIQSFTNGVLIASNSVTTINMHPSQLAMAIRYTPNELFGFAAQFGVAEAILYSDLTTGTNTTSLLRTKYGL
jgi:hypothetical protein